MHQALNQSFTVFLLALEKASALAAIQSAAAIISINQIMYKNIMIT